MSEVEFPWKKSKSGNVYCPLPNVPNEIRTNLQLEDNYVKTIGEYSYKVRVFNDNVLVFREYVDENKRISYCKICAQNGYPNIQIKWQKSNGKWVPREFDNSDELHSHRGFEYEEYEEMGFR
jgi:hypothetical protein